MDERYSDQIRSGVAARSTPPVAVAESPPATAMARELIAQLLPGVDAERLIRALLAERIPSADTPSDVPRYDSDSEISMRELRRVRAQFVLGDASRTLQHAFNNPLTALLAEAQLLELEPLADEPRAAVSRILELSRRLVTLSRRLTAVEGAPRIG